MRHLRTLVATAAALATLLAPAAAWAGESDTSSMQDRIEQVISENGGEQTAWNEVTWDDGEVVLTLADDQPASTQLSRAAAVDNCTAGKYCVYELINYGGSKLTYTSCPATYTSFSPLRAIRSIKNDRSSGTIRAYAGSTLKNTLSAGTGATSVSSITKVTCSS